jgi:hypothetical protein
MFAKFYSMSASIHLKSLMPRLSAADETKREQAAMVAKFTGWVQSHH